MRVCLINDSFPPAIDGVATVVINYAEAMTRSHGQAVVAAPDYPGETDNYPFEVVRYPSINTEKLVGYRTGNAFSPAALRKLEDFAPDVIHAHCPMTAMLMARLLKDATHAPLVFTYHTKFDVELKKAVKLGFVREAVMRVLVDGIASCDEVWAVGRGAAENLRSLGYNGECIVMPNGVDMPRGRVSAERIDALSARHSLPKGVPVLLFAGRLMWYKGIRIILDALALLRAMGVDFRMLFVGQGLDGDEIEKYAASLGLDDLCVFTGMIRDRELLRDYFCRADLFLFPSTFDTNGLVVREAAACALPSVLVRGSCAAEDVTEGEDALLIEENAEDLARVVAEAIKDPARLRAMGQRAMETLYLSWDDAVGKAVLRYEGLMKKRAMGKLPDKPPRLDKLFEATSEMMGAMNQLYRKWEHMYDDIGLLWLATWDKLMPDGMLQLTEPRGKGGRLKQPTSIDKHGK